MKLGALTLFKRSGADSVVLAMWKGRDAKRWRWCLTWSRRIVKGWFKPAGESRRVYRGRSRMSFTSALYLPYVGNFHLDVRPK